MSYLPLSFAWGAPGKKAGLFLYEFENCPACPSSDFIAMGKLVAHGGSKVNWVSSFTATPLTVQMVE